MCAKFGSDWFRNMNLYKIQTNKQAFSFIYKISAFVGVCFDTPVNKFYLGKALAACSNNHKKHNNTVRGTFGALKHYSSLTLRLLMSYIYIYIYIYIYGAPILDVSRSHTTTQHSR